ncbi:MAG TPA: flavin monoamine oxidase family protein [Bradyrhizobium sp.]|jgi:monoamine oxidase|uniref:NAD(P)/FAD-dependent oxidoreductase n=1 Tax=Bradyrhizobium sp. TaxID=376 RepID=UPI002CB8CBBC|nr:flavin monoamine oxidase family protein [Bradyrhizobium sp.]HTB02991.1 flavin monoamine oxidase family protein [Bradyrhizobium sp.]
MPGEPVTVSRRDLLSLIGTISGSAAMYHAMTALGFAADSGYRGPIKLEGDAKGASVLILGAGLAGMTAALELRKAGYSVQILEFNSRPGGRNWTLRGGDSFTELGGAKQTCEFDDGLYLNPGPWRIPYHHRALLDYCKRLNVALEPFLQLNHNALLHASSAFGGTPQRIRDIKTDFQGQVSELLAKVTQQGKLDEAVTKEDREILLQALRAWGALDRDYAYKANLISADMRGFAKNPGGGLTAVPVPGEPIALSEILHSQLWRYLQNFARYQFQTTMFQPVGGMDMIGKAFAKEVGDLIRYDAKVTAIAQDDRGVTVTWTDLKSPATPQQAKADWCVCTIPLSILSQLAINVGARMKAAIDAVPYSASVKIGLQFKRRFWEEDEAIYGGISYTDLPIRQIAYPNSGFNRAGKGVLLGAYLFDGANAFEFTAMPPAERVARAVEFGARLHPQYASEFENGIAVAWHRMPFTLGCAGDWSDATRAKHYNDLCQIDGRIVLAGEHASYIPAWQEGAILSSLDAIGRLHERVVKT